MQPLWLQGAWVDAYQSRFSAIRVIRHREPLQHRRQIARLTGLLSRARQYIYSDKEIERVVAQAARLSSAYGLRGPTFATLFGLLAASGLRLGEALGLD